MVVVACPRSGTTTLAKVLGYAHESRFATSKPAPIAYELRPLAHSEVSWMAAPHVSQLLAQGVPLLHLVRHPLRVIASLVAIGFWTTAHKAYRELAIAHVPECEGKSPVLASALLWLRWNGFCAGLPRVRIEDVANAPRLNAGPAFEVAWDDIGDEAVRRDVRGLATEEYGYLEMAP